ncbi:xanthine dehydrogenase small subunit [Devosia pacifica]|uniref:Xanthine dehydrogenase small subunit n=1 Tax=Devosia pacifica TaxID=1335967 RepID=A0A918S2B8_9HYPH|nr:xanthine dehydrogenase small subunit [Devosia pacifica]GHA17601.1 xanthine dehydrogenase small subunit [Devosia pacifica]
MAETRSSIRFILNGDLVELDDVPADRTLLDFLRLDHRLRGTKEGCAEGDCGACTVLIGRLAGDNLVYESVTSCIRFVASLDGCHVVTVEHLAREGVMNPVQQAMVEHHGSQCGFCTPGFVMSLYALWMKTPRPSRAQVEQALQGNLCRCTGYAPIIRAAEAMSDYGAPEADPLRAERQSIKARLQELDDGKRVDVRSGEHRTIIPADLDDFAAAYAELPDATIVAGSTDVGLWVTKFMREISPVIHIGRLEGLKRIEPLDGATRFFAGVTYTEAVPVLVERYPQLEELMSRFAGEQIRNMGTIGGNIANGSPIGDMPPALIVLGATLTLRKGNERRDLPLEDFFIAYHHQDREPGEFVESVTVPDLPEGEKFAVYKLSKRREEDISAVCGAFRVKLDDQGVVVSARIAFGGMATTPKRAATIEAGLVGQAWTAEIIETVAPQMVEDYQPISDMRASARYRLLAAENLLRRFYQETIGQSARLRREVA